MRIYSKEFTINSNSNVELIDITNLVSKIVKDSKIKEGICYIFVPHTTAGVTINENADPSVVRDIIKKLNQVVPLKDNIYTHLEGNSHAHIKSSIVGCSLNIMIEENELKLGTWQGIYFCEFDGPRRREVWVKIFGE